MVTVSFDIEGEALLDKIELTFFLKDFNPNRKNDFLLKLKHLPQNGE